MKKDNNRVMTIKQKFQLSLVFLVASLLNIISFSIGHKTLNLAIWISLCIIFIIKSVEYYKKLKEEEE